MGELANLRPDKFVPPQEQKVEGPVDQKPVDPTILDGLRTDLEALRSYGGGSRDSRRISELEDQIAKLGSRLDGVEDWPANVTDIGVNKPKTGSGLLERIKAAQEKRAA